MQQVNITNHLCILLRISNFYFALTLVQLTLTISFLLTMHKNMIEIAEWIEIWLAIFIFVDLAIRLFSERKLFWFNKWNIIDICIFLIVLISIVITCTHFTIHHSTNNTIGALLMTIRYIVQIYRLIVLVKTTKQIREQHQYQGMINLKIGNPMDLNVQTTETIQTAH